VGRCEKENGLVRITERNSSRRGRLSREIKSKTGKKLAVERAGGDNAWQGRTHREKKEEGGAKGEKKSRRADEEPGMKWEKKSLTAPEASRRGSKKTMARSPEKRGHHPQEDCLEGEGLFGRSSGFPGGSEKETESSQGEKEKGR